MLSSLRTLARRFRRPRPRPPLKLQDMKHNSTIYDFPPALQVVWGFKSKGFNSKGLETASVIFTPANGQINFLHVNTSFTNRGLGKQIVAKTVGAIDSFQKDLPHDHPRVTSVSAVSSVDDPFWSNVFGGVFHTIEAGDGSKRCKYFADIDELLRAAKKDGSVHL
jgi:hypothetical protein